MNRSNFLAVLAILFANMTFVMAIIYSNYEPRWITSYIALVLLYSALHARRSTDLPPGLRRRLGKAAVALGLFLTALFFYSFAPGMSWWVAVAAWLGLAATSYFAYGVVMLDTGEEEEEAALVQLQVTRPSV